MEMDLIPNIANGRKHRVIDLLRRRELQESAAHFVSQKLQVTDNFISRLGLEGELKGHEGCVNCLEWNEAGQILASASDDMHIILWDAFRYEKKLSINSGHTGNIFSVKFMPKSNDSVLVSGAGDNRIRVHDITLADTILSCNCHTGRVKRIATAPNIPYLFWSAAEDGIVMQFDMRAPHICKSQNEKNVLVNLVDHIDCHIEAKCISVNDRRPELIAVGANDPFIRMYDRRMIKLSSRPIMEQSQSPFDWLNPQRRRNLGNGDVELNDVPLGCVKYFIAGHLRTRQGDHLRNWSTTYLKFNNDGNELLVNMGGEQIYLFDINEQKKSRSFIAQYKRNYCLESNGNNQDVDDYSLDSNDSEDEQSPNLINIAQLPAEIDELKKQGNENFKSEKYNIAINLYNIAISLCSKASELYNNRAAAYMKRNWRGDKYAALRDCQMTLLLDPNNIKAHFRLARCLNDLKKPSDAILVIEKFQKKFPEYSHNNSFKALKKDIKEALNIESTASYPEISHSEKQWRHDAKDYTQRFCGHCNTTTDIKEANFFGNNGQYIVAGSDDGSFFVWDRVTTNIVRILRGDERIVNCLQPHPSVCLLATSGIDPEIRLWSPLPEDGKTNDREIENVDDTASANHIRMNSDPFDLMLMNMGYRFPGANTVNDEDDEPELQITRTLDCRPS